MGSVLFILRATRIQMVVLSLQQCFTFVSQNRQPLMADGSFIFSVELNGILDHPINIFRSLF